MWKVKTLRRAKAFEDWFGTKPWFAEFTHERRTSFSIVFWANKPAKALETILSLKNPASAHLKVFRN